MKLIVGVLLLVAAIATPALSLAIECEFVDWDFSTEDHRYTCVAKQQSNKEISEVSEVSGYHKGHRSNGDVEALIFNGETAGEFNEIPTNFAKFFPNLIKITIYKSGLTKISSEDLAPWSNLTYLGVWSNKIETLESNLFQHSPKLEKIDFDNNSLRSVGAGLIDNLKELKIAYFSGNPCIDLMANTPEKIEELKEKLSAQCSAIETVQESTT